MSESDDRKDPENSVEEKIVKKEENISDEKADDPKLPDASEASSENNENASKEQEQAITKIEEPTEQDLAAAAVAGFEEDEDDQETLKEEESFNVILKAPSKSLYKTGSTYTSKTLSTSQSNKPSRTGVDLDDPGDINGKATLEYNINSLSDSDKPWKRPGADITDYFNYGFTEDTWHQYCEKQKVLRLEYANSTLKPLSNHLSTANLSGLMPRSRHNVSMNKIESLSSNMNNVNQNMNFNPSMGNMMSHGNNISVIGGGNNQSLPNFSLPPPVIGNAPNFHGNWPVNSDPFNGIMPHMQDEGGRERHGSPDSQYSDEYKMRRRRRYDAEGYGRSTRHRSRSGSDDRHYRRRRDDRDRDRERERDRDRDRDHDRSSRRHVEKRRHRHTPTPESKTHRDDRDRERDRDRDRHRDRHHDKDRESDRRRRDRDRRDKDDRSKRPRNDKEDPPKDEPKSSSTATDVVNKTPEISAQ